MPEQQLQEKQFDLLYEELRRIARRARDDPAPARDAGDAAGRRCRSCRVCRARSSRSPTPHSAARGRGCGGARRAQPAIAIPIASIRTSTGVPWRPSTKVWWNSSLTEYASAIATASAIAVRPSRRPEAAQGTPPAERQHRVLGHVSELAEQQVERAVVAAARLRGEEEDAAITSSGRHSSDARRAAKEGFSWRWRLTLDWTSARDGDSLITITSKSRYAVQALTELARLGALPGGQPVPIAELARRREIPLQFLEQLFATLRRAGMLQSQRGVKGGYTFMKDSVGADGAAGGPAAGRRVRGRSCRRLRGGPGGLGARGRGAPRGAQQHHDRGRDAAARPRRPARRCTTSESHRGLRAALRFPMRKAHRSRPHKIRGPFPTVFSRVPVKRPCLGCRALILKGSDCRACHPRHTDRRASQVQARDPRQDGRGVRPLRLDRRRPSPPRPRDRGRR